MLPDKTELQTRKEQIDKMLVVAGWVPICTYFKDIRFRAGAIKEYETAAGPADYILFDNDEALAVVEVKMPGPSPQGALEQARTHSKAFQDGLFDFGGFHVPFAYSTDSESIWFRDLRSAGSASRQVGNFHTRSALREMLERDAAPPADWFSKNTINMPSLRPSQTEAIRGVERAIGQKRQKMLVVMAPGPGKAITIVAMVHRLMGSGMARRVLWLVDTQELAAQARSAAATTDAEPGRKFDRLCEVYGQGPGQGGTGGVPRPDWKVLPVKHLTDPRPGASFVYICTIRRMAINLFGRQDEGAGAGGADGESDAERLDIPIHAFDCVIADECHGVDGAQGQIRWRDTLEHFDGIRIGFTAAPAAHASAYFGEAVNRSFLERAKDGKLPAGR